jgi:hypothetical protein
MKKFFTLLVALTFLLITGQAFSQSEYEGRVRYTDDARTPVKSVTVELYDSFGSLVATEITNGNGKYKFKNITPGSYTIKFSGSVNGATVDSRDAFLLMMRLFGVISFSPIQELAADVNGDGRVNWKDLEAIVKDYFTYGIRNSIGQIVALPKTVQIGGMTLKDGDDDDVGSGGDMEGVFQPTTKTDPKGIELKYAKKINLRSDELIEVPVYLKNQASVGGFLMSFNFPEHAINMEGITSQFENVAYSNTNGIINVVWQNMTLNAVNFDMSKPLFVLKFRTNTIGESDEIENIGLNSQSNLVDGSGMVIKDAQVSLPSFAGIGSENVLSDIYPNPVYNSATINYSLSSAYKVSLKIYNTVGQLVSNLVNEEQAAGNYEVVFNRAYLHLSAGSYIYRLECEGENPFVQSKIMIIR